MSLFHRKEFDNATVMAVNIPGSESYTDQHEGRISAIMESLQALRYAKYHGLCGEEMARAISFSNEVREMAYLNFDELHIRRISLGLEGAYQVEVSVLVHGRSRCVSYTCMNVL